MLGSQGERKFEQSTAGIGAVKLTVLKSAVEIPRRRVIPLGRSITPALTFLPDRSQTSQPCCTLETLFADRDEPECSKRRCGYHPLLESTSKAQRSQAPKSSTWARAVSAIDDQHVAVDNNSSHSGIMERGIETYDQPRVQSHFHQPLREERILCQGARHSFSGRVVGILFRLQTVRVLPLLIAHYSILPKVPSAKTIKPFAPKCTSDAATHDWRHVLRAIVLHVPHGDAEPTLPL